MRKLVFLLAFVCALVVSSFAQTAQDITVSGILYNGFNDPCTSCTFTVTVTRRDGVAVQSTPRTVTSHASTGAVSFTLPRKSFVTFQGSYTVGRYNWRSGISMFLPDQSTIDIVDIQSVDDAAAALVAVSAAPSDAQYIVATANGTLSAEQSLGALTTGLLKNTVASSVGTLSTAVAGTDYLPAINGLTEDASPDSANDFVVTYDASAAAHKKVKLANLPGGGGGAVSSVFGRTGAVTAATNDYTWAQVDKTTSSLADITTRSASDLSSGTLAAARGGAGTISGILKANGSGVVSAAASGTDYAPATSGTAILKGDGSGGFSNAASGTDYEVPLTFSTGLTRSTNTITVNTSQNIATLSNLTSNGLVTTSGGDGTLGVTVPGSGVLTALAVNVGSAGAFVVNGGALGTPSSGTLTNATGLPLSTGVTGDLPFANFVQAGSAGFVGATGAGDYSHRTPAQVTAALDNFVGDSGSGGAKGLVPAPASGDAAANKYLKADGTWATVSGGSGITVGTTTVTSGTATRLFYETAGNVVGQISGATSDGTTVTLTSPTVNTGITLNAAPLTMSGNISSAAWTTNGLRIKGVPATLTDTTSSGTVAAAYTDAYGGNTIAASSSTTFTNYYTTFMTQPTAGSNVTFTNRWALGLSGALRENIDAIGTTSTDGIVLENTTAAAAGAQQYSPRLRLTGQGWKTNATAASQTTDWVVETQPVQGAASPTASLAFRTQVNAGGYTTRVNFGSADAAGVINMTATSSTSTPHITINGSTNGGIAFSSAGGSVSLIGAGTENLRANTNGIGVKGGIMLGSTVTSASVGTSGVGVLAIANGTAPSSSPADEFQLYSADSAAGDANAFARNEAGEINRLTGLSARVSTQFDKTSDTTLANVTGLSRNVEAGRTYAFTAVLYTTSNVAGGIKAAIGGTATATSIIYQADVLDGSTQATVGTARATALATTVGDVTTVTAARITITGTIVVNAAGTLTVQFAQNASNGSASSVLVNSSFQLVPIS